MLKFYIHTFSLLILKWCISSLSKIDRYYTALFSYQKWRGTNVPIVVLHSSTWCFDIRRNSMARRPHKRNRYVSHTRICTPHKWQLYSLVTEFDTCSYWKADTRPYIVIVTLRNVMFHSLLIDTLSLTKYLTSRFIKSFERQKKHRMTSSSSSSLNPAVSYTFKRNPFQM